MLRKRNVPDSLLDVLVVHDEGEPYDEHGHTPLIGQVLAKQLKTDEHLTILLTAIAKHTSMCHQIFDAHLFPPDPRRGRAAQLDGCTTTGRTQR